LFPLSESAKRFRSAKVSHALYPRCLYSAVINCAVREIFCAWGFVVVVSPCMYSCGPSTRSMRLNAQPQRFHICCLRHRLNIRVLGRHLDDHENIGWRRNIPISTVTEMTLICHWNWVKFYRYRMMQKHFHITRCVFVIEMTLSDRRCRGNIRVLGSSICDRRSLLTAGASTISINDQHDVAQFGRRRSVVRPWPWPWRAQVAGGTCRLSTGTGDRGRVTTPHQSPVSTPSAPAAQRLSVTWQPDTALFHSQRRPPSSRPAAATQHRTSASSSHHTDSRPHHTESRFHRQSRR